MTTTTQVFFRRLYLGIIPGLVLSGCGLMIDNEDRLNRAEQAMLSGDYRAAIIDSKTVLRDEPDNVDARLLLGRAALGAGDAATAEAELRRAVGLGADLSQVAVDIGNALLALQRHQELVEEITDDLVDSVDDQRDILELRGQAFLGLGRPADAREIFVGILDRDGGHLGAQVGIVSSYIQEGNLAQARASVDFITESYDDSIAAWNISGKLALATKEFGRAEIDYGQALRLAQDQNNEVAEAHALLGLANALLSQNQVDDARKVVSQMATLAPELTEVKELAARIAIHESDWTLAQENLQEILREFPNYRPAQMMLGAVHLESGNLAQAEMYLSAVVAAVPTNDDARRFLAETRYRLDKSDAARKTLQPLLDASDVNTRSLEMAARSSLNSGDFEYAAKYLQRAVDTDPDNPESQLGLVVAYLMADQFDEAQVIIDSIDVGGDETSRLQRDILVALSLLRRGEDAAALERAKALYANSPDNPLVLNLVGILEFANGDFQAARASFEALSALAPRSLMSIRYLAAVDEAEGKYGAAKSRYSEVIDASPRDVPAMLAMARMSAREEDFLLAQSWLRKAIDADPSSIDPRLYLGRMLVAIEDFKSARTLAQETAKLFADSAAAHGILGLSLSKLGESQKAIRSFNQAIVLDPDDMGHRIGLARAQSALGDEESATDTIERAYEVKPDSVAVAVLLAAQKMNDGDLDGAILIARELQHANPENAIPLSLEAEILVRNGSLSNAVRIYDKILDIDDSARLAMRAYQVRGMADVGDQVKPLVDYLEKRPLNHEVRLFLAQAFQADGQNEKAIDEYETTLAAAPDNYVAANNLAWIYFMQNDPRAEATARLAYESAPSSDSVIDTLGWILVQNGEVEEGVRMLRNAVSLSNGRAEISYHLAVGLVEAGKRNEARKILARIVASDDAFSSRNEAEALISTL